MSSLQSVKWWQWAALALALGLMLGALRRWELADLGRAGETLNGAAAFEQALTHQLHGRPLFDNVQVRKQTLGDTARKVVDVVSGEYCDGRPDPTDGEYHWRPTVFVAGIPFRPQVSSAEALALRDMPTPSVLDYLQLLSQSNGVRYTNAWWDSYPLIVWTAGFVIILGVLWPAFVNWWHYGTLVSPDVEKGISQSNVQRRACAANATAAALRTDDETRLGAIEAETQDGTVPAAAEIPTATAPIRALAAGVPAAPIPHQAVVEKDFGANKDDYYPTELRRCVDPAGGKLL